MKNILIFTVIAGVAIVAAWYLIIEKDLDSDNGSLPDFE